VIAVGFVSPGCAVYVHYLVIEQTQIGLACDARLRTWQCLSRTVVSVGSYLACTGDGLTS
jgi:hypothetical protein